MIAVDIRLREIISKYRFTGTGTTATISTDGGSYINLYIVIVFTVLSLNQFTDKNDTSISLPVKVVMILI